jgi:hypothetical protein
VTCSSKSCCTAAEHRAVTLETTGRCLNTHTSSLSVGLTSMRVGFRGIMPVGLAHGSTDQNRWTP